MVTFKYGQEIAQFEGHDDFFKYELERAKALLEGQKKVLLVF